ncbi:MAG: cytidylate kinase-like family protein [Eubacteriales bacterium]|nr:cytidylate kinase-like family protein [Eubacteriales bacterium]
MACKSVITIGRQYGSGGREIGQKIAETLGIKCYDNELLDRAAKNSGICQELFENHDEKPTNSFLYSLVMDTYSMGYASAALSGMPINHKVFLAQFNAIKEIANEGPCVMVGRCADYALDDFSNRISVFIYGDMSKRIRRIANKYDLTDAKAKDVIQKTDKQRASYYNYYTSKRWGDISSYDLCINSSILGIDKTAEFICNFVREREAVPEDMKKRGTV